MQAKRLVLQSTAIFGSDEPQVTHGDVLEAVGETCANVPVSRAEAAAIQSAEAMALGESGPAGGLGSAAYSAALKNERRIAAADGEPGEDLQTLGDVLQNAKEKLLADKAVDLHDAIKVSNTEKKHNPTYVEQWHGMGTAEQMAAAYNEVNTNGTTEVVDTVEVLEVAGVIPPQVTHGDFLQEVLEDKGNEPVTPSDAVAIGAVETLATDEIDGPIARKAEAAARFNLKSGVITKAEDGWNVNFVPGETATISNVLENLNDLPADRPVSMEDAATVQSVEAKCSPSGHTARGGVAAHAQRAAAINQASTEVENL